MNQFHMKDRMTRKQFYYLHLMEPKPADKTNPKGSDPSSPVHIFKHISHTFLYSITALDYETCLCPQLEIIVSQGKLDLIMHPVVLKLITVKWNLYGR